ncbi:pentatricopeptide repeat-containing protein At3g53360, mitochondrial [Oryza sativa Japonica Group]|uniref:Os06g0506100 protein n=2 Tax=Oryza sativa subsp. japonica TaxID=39947 RepID=A0A0P0WX17_ORYSJ|nr:pentatricopeptide repeat-containing protein At3g53360, mitochondrial [Oryza sativa Japonica Group]XP_015643283.1 pentatricopeptide repeat-containing protein At3g53360, mitochondrial [Oryza sativa Japonica Group]XP_015643292.1 pentatricopeptide repeat-containing protein At3g53360, mitochondrial [Oryza sativa Japonica Group]XP_025882249.1 pentatricopeptide repeat-containing protein At3g53360, mitochondrial [Oryza sativa Japonica Group]XP_025882250.1 pentatricopeptide repeat-containing protein |eukprot:NP_001057720.1 Os06g0506100 [Oryza sativa Japonica Group]
MQNPNGTILQLYHAGRLAAALRAFESLPSSSPASAAAAPAPLTAATYAALVSACSRLRSLPQGRRVHRHLVASSSSSPDAQLAGNTVLGNHLITMYGRCAAPDSARQVFDEMPARNPVSWASVIAAHVQNGRAGDALGLFSSMLRSGTAADQFALGSAVRACTELGDVGTGRQVHAHALKSERGSDLIVQNALVTMYSKNGLVDDGFMLFERIKDKDLISWGSIIAGFAQQGFEMEALQVFREMIVEGSHHPNEFHFGSAFRACGAVGSWEYGEQIHGLSIKYRLDRDLYVGCSLSDMYARCKNLDSARVAFYRIEAPDLVSWNSIVNAYSVEGLLSEALVLFSEMRDSGLRPDGITVRGLLCACVGRDALYHGRLIHSYLVKLGLDGDVSVCNSLLSMYARCSDLSSAMDVFHEIKDQDVVTWNSILTACAQHNHPEEVLKLFSLLNKSEPSLDRISLNNVLSASAELGYFEMVKQVHAYAFKAGLVDDRMLSNTLIDTYAKCGSLDDAMRLFEIMGNNRDVFSWSSLIVGYAQFGYAKEAFDLFSRMRSLGIRPNHVTFIGVLTACSRVGFVNEGCYYYSIMEPEYGIVPTREHCSCIVDLLARAGKLTEAANFIDQMPFEPDIIMWKTLLAASKMHNDMEMGKRAAEGILNIDPSHSAAYVLLCNIYAASGNWNEFARLKKAMRTSGVKKSPGKSWVKLKGELKVFIVEDRSHPESEEIYAMLELIGMEMIKAGYVPKHSWKHAIVDHIDSDLFNEEMLAEYG